MKKNRPGEERGRLPVARVSRSRHGPPRSLVVDTNSSGVNVGFSETFRAKIGYKLPFKVFKERKFSVDTLESSEALSREQTQ